MTTAEVLVPRSELVRAIVLGCVSVIVVGCAVDAFSVASTDAAQASIRAMSRGASFPRIGDDGAVWTTRPEEFQTSVPFDFTSTAAGVALSTGHCPAEFPPAIYCFFAKRLSGAAMGLAISFASDLLPVRSNSCTGGPAATLAANTRPITVDPRRSTAEGDAISDCALSTSAPLANSFSTRDSIHIKPTRVGDSVFVILRVGGPTPGTPADRWVLLPRGKEPATEETGPADIELFIDAKGRVICAVRAGHMLDVTLLIPGRTTRIQTSAHCVEASLRGGRVGLSGTDDQGPLVGKQR